MQADPEEVSPTHSSGKKQDKSSGSDEPKPRIVLTFRSEKTGTKSSNMKIVSTEEKHEEISPRRSSRTRHSNWESEGEHYVSPTKDKNVSQPVSETDDVSDSSHTTTKRSMRRRSKEFSDNVLANAIARKEKSYNETITPSTSQRPSRKIKPTPKVLANKELRIGLERENIARFGISVEEGVRTRRSARGRGSEVCDTVENFPFPPERKRNLKRSHEPKQETEVQDLDEVEEKPEDAKKLKHLCELGLKAVTPAEEECSDSENKELENEGEGTEEDDDPEVINKLIEGDEESVATESSEDEFLCTTNSTKRRPRRSTRLCSSYESPDVPDSDQEESSMVLEEDDEKVPRRRSSRKSRYQDNFSDEMMPAGGEEAGEEATCPEQESRIIATCHCEVVGNVYAAPGELTEPVFCQAIDSVDGVRVGCSHGALKDEDGSYSALIRAGLRAPYVMACVQHHAQMKQHMCCPTCGLFCTQGIFYQCSAGHLFHLECGLPYNEPKPLVEPGCPHCGVFSYRWQPANVDCVKVSVQMNCSNKRLLLTEQRLQSTQAYITFPEKEPANRDFIHLVPPEILLELPADLLENYQKSNGEDPAKVIVALNEVLTKMDESIPKISCIADVNKGLESEEGGTALHAAARRGQLLPLVLLQLARAHLDVLDHMGRTPLMLAVLELVDKTPIKEMETSTEEAQDDDCEQMEVDKNEEVEKDQKEDITERKGNVENETEEKKEGIDENELELKEEKEESLENKQELKDNPEKIDDSKETEEEGETEKIDKGIDESEEDNCKKIDEESKDVLEEKEIDAEKEVKTEDISEENEAKRTNDEDLLKVIRYLVASGCDVNHAGPEGLTALHLAAQYGNKEVCSIILSSPVAKVDARDHGGWTPLVWAAENKYSEVVRYLLSKGADAMATDAEGNAAVHWCALSGDHVTLQLLLHAAPRALHALNAHADTPLHIAARQGHYACVVVLLARGARTDVENSVGELPIDVCEGESKAAIALSMRLALLNTPKQFKLLSSDISRGRELFPLPCVNEVDDEPLPQDFTYVSRHVMPTHIEIDSTIETLQGCECEDDCSSESCACCVLSVRSWLSRGKLPVSFPHQQPPMLFECNQICGCDLRKCQNYVVSRLTQLGSLFVQAAVFRTASCGWGLRAERGVSAGAPVAVYCGELLAVGAADTRPRDNYMFAIDVHPDLLAKCEDKQQLCVDAAVYGSAARFVNHSCRPNLAPVRVFTGTRDLRNPVIAFFAISNIKPGEELTFDYGDKFWSVKSKYMKCECGHPECRYPEIVTEEEEA